MLNKVDHKALLTLHWYPLKVHFILIDQEMCYHISIYHLLQSLSSPVRDRRPCTDLDRREPPEHV